MLVASRKAVARVSPLLPFALAIGLPFCAVVLTAAANGGYFPTEWGWPTLAFLLVAVFAALVRERVSVGRIELAALGALVAFAAWTLLSLLWSTSATEPMLSLERLLVYVAFLPAVFLVVSSRTAPFLPAGVLAAAFAVCAYALVVLCFPGRLEPFPPSDGYQLSTPIGYWNGLGILAALGTLVGVGLAVDGFGLAVTALPVLLTTLYFTFSRGSWVALAAGAVVALAVERRRLRLVGVLAASLPPAVLSVWIATRSHDLSHAASLAATAKTGHRMGVALVLCTAAAAFVGWTLGRARLSLPERPRRVVGGALLALVALAALAVIVRAGGPVALVDRATKSFRAPLPATGGDLNRRLVSLSSNGRSEYWRVAATEIADRPLLGGGAGSYERYWHRERRTAYETRNAHNLYLETLAELGPAGLALLVGALAVPFAALRRVRGAAGTSAAVAAYAAFIVHAAVDWDWQIPAVTLAALACGAALLVSARRAGAGARISGRARTVLLGLFLPLAAFAIVVQVGNSALARSATAAEGGRPAEAAGLARRARRWAPWSSQPWQRLGEAQLAAGDVRAARRSLRHAVRDDRTDWSAWYDLAEASRGQARSQALAEAASLNPLSPEVAALHPKG